MSIGTPNFDLSEAGLSFLPGAICENFTSFGGRFSPRIGQTKLSQFLKYGAAGSSGTVTEPYAIQAKFPHPRIHVHYARGCTLAEAFYQSVAGPFQLLIVGDGLCQPWAKIPKLKLSGSILQQAPISGSFDLSLSQENSKVPVAAVDLFLDGRPVRRLAPNQLGKLTFNSEQMPDGHHEFRLVPIAAGPIASRGSLTASFTVDNQGKSTELKSSTLVSNVEDSIEFTATSKGAKKIQLLHNKRVIKESEGENLQVSVPGLLWTWHGRSRSGGSSRPAHQQ